MRVLVLLLLLLTSVGTQAAFLNLGWDKSQSKVIGYRVYVRTKTKIYDQVQTLGNVDKYHLVKLKQGETYYIFVTCFDETQESTHSNELVYTVPKFVKKK